MPRPTKPYGTHLVITQIRLPRPLKQRLEALSDKTGYAQQEHMRRAIDEYVERHLGKIEPAPAPTRRVFKKAEPTRRVFKRPGAVAA
jgi:hypothetical protein